MKRYLTVLLALALAFAVAAGEFDALLAFPGAWELVPDAVTRRFPRHFKALDRSSLRYNAESRQPLDWNGIPVQEAVLKFDGSGKLESAELTFYSRGDAKEPLPVREFERLSDRVREAMAAQTPGVAAQRQSATLAGARIHGFLWRGKALDQQLRSSISGRRQPEFLIAGFYRRGAAPASLRESMRTTKEETSSLASRVKSNAKGDRFLEIPMVDQGKKGYCVAASVERILRYYGSELDQHTFAQLAGSDADKGTNIDRAVEALKKIDTRIGFRYHPLFEDKTFSQEREFGRFVKEYNQIARRRHAPQLKRDRMDEPQLIDNAIFAQVRMRDKAACRRFVSEVRTSIDAGIPVCWAVLLFPSADRPDQPVSGHFRILNGYNAKLDQLIFTDSWGKGHECKSISTADAWVITRQTFQLLPKSRPARSNP